MKKVYKKSWFAMFWSFVRLVLGIAVLFAILGTVLDYKISALISVCFAALLLLLIFKRSRIQVTVSDGTLDISIGMRNYHYEVEQISLYSEQINHDMLTLSVIDKDGERQEFDLSLLGSAKYHQILTDLGVIGENSAVIQLNAQKR